MSEHELMRFFIIAQAKYKKIFKISLIQTSMTSFYYLYTYLGIVWIHSRVEIEIKNF